MNYYDSIILITSFICAAFLLIKGRQSGKAGRYLALSLVVEGLLIFLSGMVYTGGVKYIPAVDALLSLFLMINPLLYWITVYYVTSAEKEQDALVHYFYPAIIIFTLIYFIVVSCAPQDGALLFDILRGDAFHPREVSGSFKIIESLEYLRISISGLCTIILLAYSFFAFFSYRRTLAEYYSNLDNKSMLYVIILLVLMCVKAALLYSSVLFSNLLQSDLFCLARTAVFLLFYVFTTIVALKIKFTAADLRRLIAESSIPHEDIVENIQDENLPVAEIIEVRLAKMIEDRFFTDPDVNLLEFSATIKVNREYVARYLHSKYGETFSAYVNRLRIEYAKGLLSEENSQITDVAERCGYATVSTFYRNFTRQTGLPPRDFQRMSK